MSSYQADIMRAEISYRQQKLQNEFRVGGGRWERARAERRTERRPIRLGWTLRWVTRRPRHT
jgi:hypothetical protein